MIVVDRRYVFYHVEYWLVIFIFTVTGMLCIRYNGTCPYFDRSVIASRY